MGLSLGDKEATQLYALLSVTNRCSVTNHQDFERSDVTVTVHDAHLFFA